MNKVFLLGNVGTDPRMKMVDDMAVAEFRMATTDRRSIRPQGGGAAETREITEWHNIVMWGRAAEYAEKYIRSGSRLLVEGRIRTRVWEDRNAIKRNITEIYVDTFELLPK